MNWPLLGGTHLNDARQDQQQVHDCWDGVNAISPQGGKEKNRTWCGLPEAHTRVLVQRGVISAPTVSHQTKPSQVEQRHDDSRSRDDARNSGGSVLNFGEVD